MAYEDDEDGELENELVDDGPATITIPSVVLGDHRLTATAKLVYGLVSAGCGSSVHQMAEHLGTTAPTVRLSISRLTAHGYLKPKAYRTVPVVTSTTVTELSAQFQDLVNRMRKE